MMGAQENVSVQWENRTFFRTKRK